MKHDHKFFLILVLGLVRLPVRVCAESVYVKYRGVVDLDEFRCSWVSSSFVDRICYQDDARYLLVSLNGTYYHYCGVPERVFSSWLQAPSKGRFYNAYVKGRYDCRYSGY